MFGMSIDKAIHDQSEPAAQGDGKGVRYSPELWEAIRKEWAADSGMSYAAAVKAIGERLGVPVPSKGACATFAKRNGWAKDADRPAHEAAEHVQDATEHVQEVDEQTIGPIEHVQRKARKGASPARQKRPAASVRREPVAADAPEAVESVEVIEVADEVIDDPDVDLTGRQRRFADEYLIDLNATQAYLRAGYEATENTAAVNGARLLRNARVQAYITERQAALQERTEITQDMVLKRWWDIATADPNEVIEYRRTCCRNCWGVNFAYQWTEDEYEAAVRRAEKEDTAEPDCSGGFGFRPGADPTPECYMHIHDTRKLTGAARLLYAGAKVTKEGLEVKLHDQLKALDAVSRHVGFYNDKVQVNHTAHDPAELERRFGDSMALARKRMAEIRQERGGREE
jgi:phage terminase small subunit